MLTRRQFLASGVVLAAGCATVQEPSIPIIDTHTHFYDPSRPEGVPWPDKNDALLYRTVLPQEYIGLARPLGITGTVVVEASPRVEDNSWVLDLAKNEPFLRGLVGHLKPGSTDFERNLEHYAARPGFRGIRIGLWNVNLAPDQAPYLRDLAAVAERGLTVDVLTSPKQLPAVVQIGTAVPRLRMVIDHCAGVRLDGGDPDPDWVRGIRAVARNPNISMKVSGLAEATGRIGAAPKETSFYESALNVMWDAFGPRRLIFGSNWPVSARFASLSAVVGIVRPYFTTRGPQAAALYFHDNARRIYGLS